jgi:hypothetical protein
MLNDMYTVGITFGISVVFHHTDTHIYLLSLVLALSIHNKQTFGISVGGGCVCVTDFIMTCQNKLHPPGGVSPRSLCDFGEDSGQEDLTPVTVWNLRYSQYFFSRTMCVC